MTVRFEACDPEAAPATELLAEMGEELNALYGTRRRLDRPGLAPADLRPPGGAYLVAWQGEAALAGGGWRDLGGGVAEIKRMYVRPLARSQGLAGQLLAALEEGARACGYAAARLDTGPKQVHALALYRRAGYTAVAAYNDNPFACFWGEKSLT